MNLKIALIAGHGDGQPGAVSKRFGTEADLVRKIVPKVAGYLNAYKNIDCTILDMSKNWYYYVFKSDVDFSQFDYVAEMHANAGVSDSNGDGKTTGFEIYVTTREKGVSVEETVCKKIAALGMRNRGVKRTNFAVINYIKSKGTSAALYENGFMDDADDMELIFNNLDTYCKAIAEGIAEGFGYIATDSNPDVAVTLPVQKTIDELAQEVIEGLWGVNPLRKEKLTQAGYSYQAVQNRVNQILTSGSSVPKKSNKEIAGEIYNGTCSDSRWSTWGTGATRKERLKLAGYDPLVVQTEVNKLF